MGREEDDGEQKVNLTWDPDHGTKLIFPTYKEPRVS
jgi:hypothetical protein